MGKIQTFQQFLATQSTQIPIAGFIFNLFLTALLTFILSRVYARYGYSLSNRRMFAKNFVLLSMTTMLIITIVKSSLALSLGLVGALSIVRFRAAIKEPEELAYLFLCISIGLGFGAGQRLITIVAFLIIVAVIWFKNLTRKIEDHRNLFLTVTTPHPKKTGLKQIAEVLDNFCEAISLQRFDETKDILEAAFRVEYSSFDQMLNCKIELQKLSDSIKITFLDNKGIF